MIQRALKHVVNVPCLTNTPAKFSADFLKKGGCKVRSVGAKKGICFISAKIEEKGCGHKSVCTVLQSSTRGTCHTKKF